MSYYRLTCRITVGNYVLRGVNEVEIKRSVHTLIQTAKIVLPLSVVFRNKELDVLERIKLADKIKEGDAVKVEIGYNGSLKTEFEGFVHRINYKMPLEIECEDQLYLLRKVYFTESCKNITAKALIQKVLDKLKQERGVDVKLWDRIPTVTIDNFYPNKRGGSTGIWLLEELKKFGITCYLTTVNNTLTLFAGLAYDLKRDNVKYKFNSNTISTDELKFELNSDKKYKVVVTTIDRKGVKHKYEYGEEGGQVEEIRMNTSSQSVMEQKAKHRLQELLTNGYKGSIETFLLPFCDTGMIAVVTDPQFPDRDGKYYIGSVVTTFGTAGARRKPELTFRVK